MKERLPLVTIMGPTGVGKTDLAISLFKTVSLEIISVDSVQVYKGMDIGTGKPSKEILDKYPHNLLSFIDPWKSYSTALFINDATREIDLCDKSKKVPLLVGGTMLYFRSLLSGISRMPKADQNVRNELSDEAKPYFEAFYDVGSDPDNRVIIMTGTGDAFSGPPGSPSGTPKREPKEWDRTYWEGKKLLGNLLDIEVPMISAINGPALRHSEIPLLCDIVLASDTALFQDSGHFMSGLVPGDGMHIVYPMLLGMNRGR